MHQSMNQSAFNSNMSIAHGYSEAHAGLEKTNIKICCIKMWNMHRQEDSDKHNHQHQTSVYKQ